MAFAVVIMGVSGAGKSTVGNMLAQVIPDSCFLDTDDFHSLSNKEKMRVGIPLSDEDRAPWLQVLRDMLHGQLVGGKTVILGCSALRKEYREILRSADPDYKVLGAGGASSCVVKFMLLDVGAEVLAARLWKRAVDGGHFMSPALLQSQLELLEVDEDEAVLRVDANLHPREVVQRIHGLLF